MIDLLRKLVEPASVSGCEKEIRKVIEGLCAPFADEMETDALGNLVVHKRGNGPKLMLSAHMDTIGLIATYIEDEGFVRFGKVGGLFLSDTLSARVRFANGINGVIMADDIKLSDLKISELYVDIGAKNKEQAEKSVRPGDTAVFIAETLELGEMLVSPYMDDRIGCLILIEALKKITDPAFDLYFTFTVQEEVGIRGAKTAAFGIEPEYAIVVDVGSPGDTPKSTVKSDTKLGGGAMIRLLDRSALADRKFADFIIHTAEENKLTCQIDATQVGGSDAGEIHKSRTGVKTGFVSIPTRYIHSVNEMVNKTDVESCIDIIKAVCEKEYDPED